MADRLINPKLDDLIIHLQALRSRYGNLPVVGEREDPQTFRFNALKEDHTTAREPKDAVNLFLEIY